LKAALTNPEIMAVPALAAVLREPVVN